MGDDRNSTSRPQLQIALRAKQAAAALGISERHLWQLTEDGHIPCSRVGTGSRPIKLYLPSELESWLKNASHRSASRPPSQQHPGSGPGKYFSPDK